MSLSDLEMVKDSKALACCSPLGLQRIGDDLVTEQQQNAEIESTMISFNLTVGYFSYTHFYLRTICFSSFCESLSVYVVGACSMHMYVITLSYVLTCNGGDWYSFVLSRSC